MSDRLCLVKSILMPNGTYASEFKTGFNCEAIERTGYGFCVEFSGGTVLVPWSSITGAFPADGTDWDMPDAAPVGKPAKQPVKKQKPRRR